MYLTFFFSPDLLKLKTHEKNLCPLSLFVNLSVFYTKGKSVEQLRKHFNIVNDFTPEEEERVMNENRWAEESS